MKHETSSYTIKRVRVKLEDDPLLLGRFTMLVAEHGARFGEITTFHIGKDHKVRDADIIAPDEAVFDAICDAIRQMGGIDLLEVKDVVHETHLHGKIEIAPRVAVKSIDDLQLVYTPGVASVCRQIEANPSLAYELTGIQNSVAIVTNGTAILGLGDIGPVAGMPVMEGKALLFRLLAGISGYPILVDSKDPDEIVRTVAAIAKTFGAIKLEDIRALRDRDAARRGARHSGRSRRPARDRRGRAGRALQHRQVHAHQPAQIHGGHHRAGRSRCRHLQVVARLRRSASRRHRHQGDHDRDLRR
jgi:malate dehydrogenase (oxaloacetate-decarboxylating)